MRSHSGVAAKMFDVLAHEQVNIDMISTSEIKVSVVIDLAKGEQALRALHQAFIG
jgi:aspartate kinase